METIKYAFERSSNVCLFSIKITPGKHNEQQSDEFDRDRINT